MYNTYIALCIQAIILEESWKTHLHYAATKISKSLAYYKTKYKQLQNKMSFAFANVTEWVEKRSLKASLIFLIMYITKSF